MLTRVMTFCLHFVLMSLMTNILLIKKICLIYKLLLFQTFNYYNIINKIRFDVLKIKLKIFFILIS